MSLTDLIGHKYAELWQIESDMRGINPGISLYKRLSDRRAVLKREIEQLEERRAPLPFPVG